MRNKRQTKNFVGWLITPRLISNGRAFLYPLLHTQNDDPPRQRAQSKRSGVESARHRRMARRRAYCVVRLRYDLWFWDSTARMVSELLVGPNVFRLRRRSGGCRR